MMERIIVAVASVLFLTLMFSGCIGEQETIELKAGWNKVTITVKHLQCLGSDDPDIVFAGLREAKEASVFRNDSGDWCSWLASKSWNTMEQVIPNREYEINVEEDFLWDIC